MLRRDLASLHDRTFDLVIVGGGISGACLAHEAAQRGLAVALVERLDFGGATSAASSKVLHSGIRYLQQFQLGKVRESAVERCRFQRIAPHLTRYVPFLIPTYRSLVKGRTALRAALLAHELLCLGQNAAISDPSKRVPRSRCCSRTETLSLAPVLGDRQELTGACLLYESHMHSAERMTLAFLKSAAGSGAVVANYVSARRLLIDRGAAGGIAAVDELNGQPIDVRARLVANVAGPWIPDLNRAFGTAARQPLIARFSKGAHIVTRPLTGDVALVLPTARRQRRIVDRGGRHVFVIPWRGRSLIGTSNVPYEGTPEDVRATDRDVIDLVADINGAVPGVNLSLDDVQHAFAGLYPLTGEQAAPDVYGASGTYQVIDHRATGIDGVVSILGAKFTTARRLAEQAADLIVAKLGVSARPSLTATTPLAGGNIEDLPAFVSHAIARHRDRLAADAVRHLVDHYGTETDAVAAVTAPGLRPFSRLAPERECIEAEVAFAVTHEMAVRLDDVVLRRTGLGTIGHPGVDGLRRCGEIMAGLLGWSGARLEEELSRTDTLLKPVARGTQ